MVFVNKHKPQNNLFSCKITISAVFHCNFNFFYLFKKILKNSAKNSKISVFYILEEKFCKITFLISFFMVQKKLCMVFVQKRQQMKT